MAYMCSDRDNRHQIEITNLLPNEHVSYAVLLLKGTITDCCSLDSASIFVSLSGSETRFPCTDIRRSQNSTGSFKCLVRLRPGANSVHIQYCDSTFKLPVVFDECCDLETARLVKIKYVICEGHDGRFQSNDDRNTVQEACHKIDMGIQLIQCLIAEKLQEAGFCRRTFQFTPCQPFHSELSVGDAREMSGAALWSYLAREFVAADSANPNTKYVGFLSCTLFTGLNRDDYADSDIKANTKAHVALGAGDVALFGTGCLYTWPSNLSDVMRCFENREIVPVSRLMDDSNSRRTIGGCFATTLGSLCHEIGHIFDLGHTEEGIMGNGFDYVNRVFTHELTTVSLPPRLINACQTTPVATKPRMSNDVRLTKIKKPTQFLQKYQSQRDNDLTFFCDNSNIMLFYHKWLNRSKNMPNSIQLDKESGKVVSDLPLRLIEFRDKTNALTRDYVSFHQSDVSEHELPKKLFQSDCDILVVDDNGNISKF